jgi:hypothetical protein
MLVPPLLLLPFGVAIMKTDLVFQEKRWLNF